MRRLATRAVGPGLVAVTALVAGCGPVVLRPEAPSRVAVPGGELALTGARLDLFGSDWLELTHQGTGDVQLLDARLVYQAEPACAGVEVSALETAASIRRDGALRWERPVVLRPGESAGLELETTVAAFEHPTALEVEVAGGDPGARVCRRLTLSAAGEGQPPDWRAATVAPALGWRLYIDEEATSVLLRPGLWTGRFRHGIELGVGHAGKSSRLGEGKVLALAIGSERVWSPRIGLAALALELDYQARFGWGERPGGAARLVHGPRLGLRPLFVAPSPGSLRLGPRMGSISFLEIFVSADLGGGPARLLLGASFGSDAPLPVGLPGG